MEGFNVKIGSKIEVSGQLLTDLLTVKIDKLQIYDKLYDLVEGSVLVNNTNIERKAPPPAMQYLAKEISLMNQDNFEEQKNHEQLNGGAGSAFKTPQDKKQINNFDQNQQQSNSSS